MKIDELAVLLPCHSLEDFPTYHQGEAADGLLAAWSALWHPVCVAAAAAAPRWYRADVPPTELANKLFVVPAVGEDQLPPDFAERAQRAGALFIRSVADRTALVDAVLAKLGRAPGDIPTSLVRDFLALGYCRLQIELLARHMRHTSHLGESKLDETVVAAAQAAVAGDESAARSRLAECFSILYDARKQFYPVDTYLIDLTLVAHATLGSALAVQANQTLASNLLLPAAYLLQLRRESPDILAAVRTAVDEGRASLVGGEYADSMLPLMPLEAIATSFQDGLEHYQRLLGHRPTVFGRRTYGLSPILPQVLAKFGFRGAFHCTLDDGRFPLSRQCKTRWEGIDGSAIDALARVPCDAAKPESFLDFAGRMAESMDTDHVATVLFAHWPGQASFWYDDLRRIAQLSPVLGKFVTLDEYFQHTDPPQRISKFEPDQYRAPYLQQAVVGQEADPISRHVRVHQAWALRKAIDTITALSELVCGARLPARHVNRTNAEHSGPLPSDHVEPAWKSPHALLNVRLGEFAANLPRQAGAPQQRGWLIVNPLSFHRRQSAELIDIPTPTIVAGPIDPIEVPGMGWAWLPAEPSSSFAARAANPLAHQHTLRNELIEVVIGAQTGGIQSIRGLGGRGNRLSQQLALRAPRGSAEPGNAWPDPDEAASYTTMIAESIEVTSAGPPLAEIASRGGLFDHESRRVARFRQIVRLWQGSRAVELGIELELVPQLPPDPWNAYFASRFAWADKTADLFRGVGLARQRTEARRLEAPEYIEIGDKPSRITILTGGLPYHRRIGDRMLDTLLIVRGERARSFRLGIGLDLPQPAAAALNFVTPLSALEETAAPPTNTTSWLLHVDARNVVLTHLEAIVDPAAALQSEPAAEEPQKVRGFRARLLETAGRGGPVSLRSFRPVRNARKIDFQERTLFDLPVEKDRICMNLTAFEWAEIEAFWDDRSEEQA